MQQGAINIAIAHTTKTPPRPRARQKQATPILGGPASTRAWAVRSRQHVGRSPPRKKWAARIRFVRIERQLQRRVSCDCNLDSVLVATYMRVHGMS